MLVTVEGELCATGPLITDCPRHGGIFLIIECVTHVNEEKYPVFFLLMILPEHLNNMYPTLYPRFESPAYLVHPIGLLAFQDYHRKDAICKTVMPGLPNPD